MTSMLEHQGLPVHRFPTLRAMERWLAREGAKCEAIWVQFAKKGAAEKSVSKAEAIEAALAYGWIDGRMNPWDEQYWLIRFTPRRAKSRWSQINRSTAERLTAEGRMTARGQAEIDAAKADGRWDAAYPPPSKVGIPPDLQEALDASPAARDFFATLKGANRYAVLYRIHDAKTAATRSKRIAHFVAMLGRGETVHGKAG